MTMRTLTICILAAALAFSNHDIHAQAINPVPQRIACDSRSRTLDISGGIRIADVKGVFSEDFGFMEESGIRTKVKDGIKVSVNFGQKQFSKSGAKPVSGAYVLSIGDKKISITGYDERGAFYGIQTLRQLVENAQEPGKLPCMTVQDWPDLPNRGVVEGFYGTPWSHETRLSLIDFYGKFKMNTYVYGPKDDPYHSSPDWRLPYPEDEAENITELIRACKRNRIDFVWAIHPGQDIKWNEEDYANLLGKFNMMYDLGVRNFAIFFDDISGEGTNPVKQAGLLNRLTEDFVKVKGDVSPLTVCPTDYSRLWANPGPKGNLAIYGEMLDSTIKVFWTGDYVCSDLTRETLEWVGSRIKRPAYYWWNYPVTDYVRNIILQGPVYGLDTTLTSENLCGLLSNPMEHGEASKLALYGVADYTWNISAYEPLENWERGLRELVPQAYEAYRTFAIHSCDTETGYRRHESWETETFGLDQWTRAGADTLYCEFEKIEKTPSELEKGCTNLALLDELRPWLKEFGKLGSRGKHALELMELYHGGITDTARFWEKYSSNMMSAEDREAYNAHKSGTMKLQPFYENAMADMGFRFLASLSGETPKEYKGIGSFANSGGMTAGLMFDGDPATHYTSGVSQKEGSWIGADLRTVRDVYRITILQGRNSTDDTDYFESAVLETSTDGENWIALTGELEKQYEITWSAMPDGKPVKARYVRLRRLDSEKRSYAAIRSFEISTGDSVRFSTAASSVEVVDTSGGSDAAKAFDSRISTSYNLNGEISIDIPSGIGEYIFLLSSVPGTCGQDTYSHTASAAHQGPFLKIAQLDSDGLTVEETCADSPYFVIKLNDEATVLKLTGHAGIVEIVGR
ncbi:MAG: beta-N-acetylglucosaminidase domain-containing protein [Bacteroidetes bacterium]|uniref:Beta-N-acetylglucosaminidase domain-containing protein n=1 Tax=Candidatus Merdivivens pullistercoris TaxID=2840873 RepID=A0A9D9I4T7_9BACT|nr:beta-N-acetylglucosaminidase domain-containing protein [Candidatus Merdivivens pullistercoris]